MADVPRGASTTSSPSAATDSNEDSDPRTRILRKGDLARVLEAPRSRLKGRNNHLVKITRSTPLSQEELGSVPDYADSLERHPFVYDVEFVLGGKLGGIRRHELIYTTATAEGMISEGGRSQRKRKPSVAVLEQQETTASSKHTSKKKVTGKKVTKGGSTGTKRKAMGKGGGADSKRAKGQAAAPETTTETGAKAELYTKHRREFERMATRLEKVDQFGFFFDEPPPLEEPTTTSEPAPAKQQFTNADGALASPMSSTCVQGAQSSEPSTEMNPATEQVANHPNRDNSVTDGSTANSSSAMAEGPTNATKPPAEAPQAEPPSTVPVVVDPFAKPPRTWYDIQKRREAGRYELDRVKRSDEQRRKRLKPYTSWKRSARKKGNWKEQPQPPKRIRKKGGGHPRVLHPKGVHWKLFRDDVYSMCKDGLSRDEEDGKGGSGTIGHSANKIRDELDKIYQRTAKRQFSEMEAADNFHEFSSAIKATKNGEAAMQGKWRTIPFPERLYERLSSDVICAGLSAVDAIASSYEMKTTLDNRFVGISYRYNDTGQSEGWMKSVLDETMNGGGGSAKIERRTSEALRNDSGVVKAQCRATMQTLLMAVEDKVLTEAGILHSRELRSANWEGNGPDDLSSEDGDNTMQVDENVEPELVEQSVWGIDCYTRKNVIICLETEFESSLALEFVEKWLLPAMNACPEDLAHDLSNAAKLLAGVKLRDANEASSGETVDRDEQWSHSLIGQALLTKIRTTAPPWVKPAADQLLRAIETLGLDFFRVHPKGHGSIVLSQKLKANTLVTFYRGEVYPSWRWGEKMDAIDMTQERLGLRPTLPDFYNMSLERPQSDPRGYGLMIVDGSRKAGHGSMLSHSCQPTCEVRVAALDGELCLAMTTLRELEQGEELTFDYNAVTESVNEYRAAVCLCGFGGCRGSFLHFATADCYQQVLNRNSPIAVRFSNLVKGCMKQVMSADDEEVLRNHGFGTAAFGAVSLNRHLPLGQTGGRRDSMDCVPIWLRTFVADTLRYIEYERRALPISLLCEHVETNDAEATNEKSKPQASKKKSSVVRDKPENVFMYYARKKKEHFEALHPMNKSDHGGPMAGISHRHEVLRLAAVSWKALSKEEQETWKQMSIKEWREKQKGGGMVEEKKPSKAKQKEVKKGEQKDSKKDARDKKGNFNLSKISFEAADAEGVSAMEQRVQQLTQALSRVGRVLDRHKESTLAATGFLSATSQIHAPISILPPEKVVSWLWHNPSGPVQSLIEAIGDLECSGQTLMRDFQTIRLRYDATFDSYKPNSNNEVSEHKVAPTEAKESLTLALLEMRQSIQSYLVDFVGDKKKYDAAKARFRREANKLRKEVAYDSDENSRETEADTLSVLASAANDTPKMPIMDPRLSHFDDRWKLEAAADLLLFYAHTSTFLSVDPYKRLESTPVEVYARELGNAVPKSLIENSSDCNGSNNGVVIVTRDSDEEHTVSDDDEQASQSSNRSVRSKSPKNVSKAKSQYLCEPDDVITNVTVAYEGDYVLAQLLQWYNGGIGQKPGLPDMVGCAILPTMRGCFASQSPKGQKTKSETFYASDLRPMLATWIEDPHQRGSPFPEELRIAFSNDLKSNEPFPIGSPVLDLLIMGDDSNIQLVAAALSENIDSSNSKVESEKAKNEKAKTTKERLQGTVDEGMPAQAVANWVQCENPKCLKWRKLPWHVDLDLLPEKFFCKDNKWNTKAASCDSQEDAWDESDTHSNSNGKGATLADTNAHGVRDAEISVGAKFDIYRPNKKKYAAAEVIQVTRVGAVRRVRVHYAKTPERFDEWLVLPSDRIFPYMSKAIKEDKKVVSLKPEETTGETQQGPVDKINAEDGLIKPIVNASEPIPSLPASSPHPPPSGDGVPRRPSMIPAGTTPSADDMRPIERRPFLAPQPEPKPPSPTQQLPAPDVPRKKKLKTKHNDAPRKSKPPGDYNGRKSKSIKKMKKSGSISKKKKPQLLKPAAPRPGSIPRKSAGESPDKPRPTSLLSSMMAPPAAMGAKGDSTRPPKQKKPKHGGNKSSRNGGGQTVSRRQHVVGEGQHQLASDEHSSDMQTNGSEVDSRKLLSTTRRSPSVEDRGARSGDSNHYSVGDGSSRYTSMAAPRRSRSSEGRDSRARASDYRATDGPKRSSLSSEARATRAPASDYRYDSYAGERSYPPDTERHGQYYGSHQYDAENRHYDDYVASDSRQYDDYRGSESRYYEDYSEYGSYGNGRRNGQYYDKYEKSRHGDEEYDYGNSRDYDGGHHDERYDGGEYGSSAWDSSKPHPRSRHERKHR